MNLKIKFLMSAAFLCVFVLADAPVFGQIIQRDQNLSDAERKASPVVQSALLNARKKIQDKNLNFRVGITGVSGRTLESLTGESIPANIKQIAAQQNQIAAKIFNVSPAQLLNVDLSKIQIADIKMDSNLKEFEIDKFGKVKPKGSGSGTASGGGGGTPAPCAASNKRFDWRERGLVVPVRQQLCGNCWAYAVQAVYELARIKNAAYKPIVDYNPNDFNTSEQFLVSNGNAGSCKGGDRFAANKFLASFGVMKDATYPDTGTDGTALKLAGLKPTYSPIVTFGFVDADNEVPSVADIKKALCAYGPVTAGLLATDAFQNYSEGVFDENSDTGTPHAVVIVGWDDAKGAWIVRNSWGNDWGIAADFKSERGYAYVKYGSNRIGRYAQWIAVK